MERIKKKRLKNQRDDLIFYCLMFVFPVAQFCVFYIGVNARALLYAFQKIDVATNSITWTFSNLKGAFSLMTDSLLLITAMKNSILSYILIVGISTPLGLLFSYYIYKKFIFSSGFRILLFLPSIISAIIMVTIYRFFVESAIPAYVNRLFDLEIPGLLENIKTRYATLIFYCIWVGFGTCVLIYSNAMGGIPQEIVESAHIDGASGIKEFYYITMPFVYPTFTTFMITGVAGIFVNQINLYSFYGVSAPEGVQTYGYYLYLKTVTAASDADYPVISAMGLLLTVATITVTFVMRRLLDKFGPSED